MHTVFALKYLFRVYLGQISFAVNLKEGVPGYRMVWFNPQAMTNVLSFGNIVKQYPIHYLLELDTFQVQLHDCINVFGCEQVDNLYILEGHQH